MSNSEQILDFIKANPKLSSSEISERAGVKASYATVRRELAKLVADGVVVVTGKSKSSRYSISPSYQLFMPVDIATYFEKEVDERQIIGQYNFELIPALRATPAIFTKAEFEQLNALQETFRNQYKIENVLHASPAGTSFWIPQLSVKTVLQNKRKPPAHIRSVVLIMVCLRTIFPIIL